MEVFEVIFSPKFKDVRIGGVVGSADATKVATIVYQQPTDSEFSCVATTATPKLTARKVKNRNHRKNKSASRDLDRKGVGANRRSERGKPM